MWVILFSILLFHIIYLFCSTHCLIHQVPRPLQNRLQKQWHIKTTIKVESVYYAFLTAYQKEN